MALLANEARFFSDLGRSSGHVLPETKSVTPHFVFHISDVINSSSYSCKGLRKKSMLEKQINGKLITKGTELMRL